MKKVLFTATVDSHILAFHLPYLKYFKDNGYEVHVATNGKEKIPYCDKKFTVPIERSPYKLNNLRAIRKLKKIIDNNLKCFNFNLKSGPNLMHPLHFAVQANNIKAIEKFKKI